MASSGIGMSLVLALLALVCGGAMAQTSCTNAITSLAPCMNYVTGNTTIPSTSCCTQLASIVQASPVCLCQMLSNNGINFGITINQTLALSLPGACNVQTPPISQCNKAATSPTGSAAVPVGSPASAPAANSPADSSNQTPEPTIVPPASQNPSSSGTSGTGLKTVPTQQGASDSNIVKAPINLMLFVLFMALCGSTTTRF